MANKYGNNARALYQDIADSIRTVGKTTEEIHAYDFPEAIAAIKTESAVLVVQCAVSGRTVTISKGDIQLTDTTEVYNRSAIFLLPELGEWTIYTDNGEESSEKTINITESGIYRFEISIGLEKLEALSLSSALYVPRAVNLGQYALFTGGRSSSGASVNSISVFNPSLTRSQVTSLANRRHDHHAVEIGEYALFAGGSEMNSSGSGTILYSAEAYDTSLTRSMIDNLAKNRNSGSALVGDYAILFHGPTDGADVYDKSLTHLILDASTGSITEGSASAQNSRYALFAGGNQNGNNSNDVWAYSSSLTLSCPTELSSGRIYITGGSIGDHILFAGGFNNNNDSVNTIDIYDASLTKSNPVALNSPRSDMANTALGDFTVFAGGQSRTGVSTVLYSTVEAFNNKFTRTLLTGLETERFAFDATRVGNYALFGGGRSDARSSCTSSVEVYMLS